jgi:IS1 family transposase
MWPRNQIRDGGGMPLITHATGAGIRVWTAPRRGYGAGLTFFLKLKEQLEPFGITRYYTDGWGAYEQHLDAEQHQVGKDDTQKIERKHMRLRTRINRLVRCTICFSKTERMHNLAIGLFINRYEFGLLL